MCSLAVSVMQAQIVLSDSRVTVRNEAEVNSADLEYSPAFYEDGIVFVTNRHESLKATVTDTRIDENIMSLYEARRDDAGFLGNGSLFSAELLERVHEGPVTFNRTGDKIFFTRNILDKKQRASDGKRKLMIYAAEKKGNEWTKPELLPFNNAEFNSVHPVVGATDSILYFASDRPGGFGGMDLYRTEKMNGDWTEPENLGESINTGGNEVFPFFHPDGTLYFSSDNHGSLGGLDIFMTRKSSESWEQPQNLLPPFNSSDDDFGFIADLQNRNGYFSSNRPGGAGEDDIYSFKAFGENRSTADNKKEKIETEEIEVTDAEGMPLENVRLSLVGLNDIFVGKTNDGKGTVRLVPSGKPGEFTLQIDENDNLYAEATTDINGNAALTFDKNGNYILSVEKDGYIPKQILVDANTDWENLDFTLQKQSECVALSGYVRVAGKADGAGNTEVLFTDTETGAETKVYTKPDGTYVHCLPCGKSFSVYAMKNGVYTPGQIIKVDAADCTVGKNMQQDFTFPTDPGVALRENDIVELRNIYFNFNDASIRPDAENDLYAVLQMLQNFPGLAIELGSHTDARGSASYNLDLSRRRSQSVRNWLTNKGIDINRTAAVGYGESLIRNGCTDGVPCTEAEHQENRRTEFKVISADSPLLGKVNPPVFRENNKAQINVSPTDNAANAYRIISIKKDAPYLPHSVIAGTFGSYANAEKRLRQLRDFGCAEAVIKGRADGMHVVEAERFAEREKAERLAEKLEEIGIGTYVL